MALLFSFNNNDRLEHSKGNGLCVTRRLRRGLQRLLRKSFRPNS